MSEVHFTPMNDRVLVRPDAAVEESSGGIVLPGSAAQKPQEGTVVAVGPGAQLRNHHNFIDGRYPMVTKVGDRVAFSAYTERLTIGDEEFILCREDDLYGVFRCQDDTEEE